MHKEEMIKDLYASQKKAEQRGRIEDQNIRAQKMRYSQILHNGILLSALLFMYLRVFWDRKHAEQ